jgi:hypothetical protein
VEPHDTLKLDRLYEATASTKAKSPACRERYVACASALIAKCGAHDSFAVTRQSLAGMSGYKPTQTRITLEHFEATRLIERIPGETRAPGSLLANPLRYRWSDWARSNLSLGAFPGRISSESVSDRSKSDPKSSLDSDKSSPKSDLKSSQRYNSHFPLRLHSEGGESSLVGFTDQSQAGFQIQPGNPIKGAKKGYPSPPPGFAENQSLTRLPWLEGAHTAHEAVMLRLDAMDCERLEQESEAKAAELAAKRELDRWHPDVIFARLKAEEEKAAGIIRRSHGADEQDAYIRAEYAERFRQGNFDFDRTEIPKLKPMPAYEAPEYRPVGRDEEYPESWEAKIP